LTKPNFLCVLDGVGGWIEVLIDSGKMTKEFIQHIEKEVDHISDKTDLSFILDQAVSKTKAKGSTTATMAFLNDTQLKTCNLGDSGYLLLRPQDGKLQTLYRSESQQYYFNCPY